MTNSSDIDPVIQHQPSQLLSDETLHMFSLVCFFIELTVCVFGIPTNIINLIVFAKQRLSDSINVSLLGLAVSDLGGLLTSVIISLLSQPLIANPDNLPVLMDDFVFVIGYPTVFFTRTACCIMNVILIQRCIAIALPFRLAPVMTSKLTGFVIAFIYLAMFLIFMFPYFNISFTWRLDHFINRTLWSLNITPIWTDVNSLLDAIIAVINVVFFTMTIINTTILVVQLKIKTKWRQSLATAGSMNSNSLLKRDGRISVMVTTLSIIFIITNTPTTINVLFSIYLPGYTISGTESNFFTFTCRLAFLCEATYSSSHMIVYYRMSTKYRHTLNSICCRQQRQQHQHGRQVNELQKHDHHSKAS